MKEHKKENNLWKTHFDSTLQSMAKCKHVSQLWDVFDFVCFSIKQTFFAKFIMILCVEQQFNPGETFTISFIYCAHSFSVLFYRDTILKCYDFPYYTFFGKVDKNLKPGLT